VKSAHADDETAIARLAEGARMAADRRLPRLAAHIRAEQLRLGLRIDVPNPLGDAGLRAMRHGSGTAALTAEAEELAAIRALLAHRGVSGGLDPSRGYDPYFGSAEAVPIDLDDSAVKRTRALYQRIAEQHRPRAQLDVSLLLAECLSVAGWTGEAIAALTPVVVRCAELGWRRPLLDAGPRVLPLLHAMRGEILLGTEHSEITEETHRFLDSL
jgi:serine/threonine-protein kinase PknK